MPPYGGKSRRGYGGYKSRGFKHRKKESLDKRIAKVLEKKAEMKFFDYPQAHAGLVAGFQEIDNSVGDYDILEGTGTRGERIGKQVTLKKIFWRWNLEAGLLLTNQSSTTVRLFIILDKQVNGATTPGSLVWDDVTNWASFNGMLDTGRFKTLYDSGPIDMIRHGGAGNGTTNTFTVDSKSDTVFLKNLNIELLFDASTGAVSDLTKNHISFWASSRKGGIVVVSSEVRLRYIDI